ncbi:hypothetical protein FD47_GL000359 [Lentilactobacillus parafarraginis DSM 18390 = JCM 14109]|uniref:Uncharacterized protein n=1 Tax=Lentilactobacillus parafarraginis DSM 18390 = JCM 14109 TaxID=1423786 RepID=A0A0R1YY11_9LACO|nr:hypothetical protein FD47_GL000359 [Lentilactobacillus parafarraginis DSM 18390 = JCM 14109]
MRGEYPIFRKRKVSPQGSPPHAWGIPTADLKAGKKLRITPTCVGNTCFTD